MESVGPAAARHDAAGVFIDDHDLALGDDVFDVFFVEGVGAEELGDGVDFLGDLGVVVLGLGLDLFLLLGGEIGAAFEFAELGGEVGEDEGVGIVGAETGAALFGEVGLMLALVDGVEEFFLETVEFRLLEVAVHVGLGFVEELAPLGVLHEAEELLVLRVGDLDLKEFDGGGLAVVGGERGVFEEGLGVVGETVGEAGLLVDEGVDAGLEAGERLFPLDGGGAGNDERGAGFVDEDGVDFVHDAEPVVALDLVFLAGGHAVVAEVIEAEFGGGAVGDVAAIHLATEIGRHGLLDTTGGEAEEVEEVAHPLGVAAGEVVVDGDELGVPAGEGVEVKRERGDEGLAFAGGHFGDLAGVDGVAADQLDVEVDHVPGELVSADEGLGADEAAGGVLHGGESLGENLVEGLAGFQAGAELVGLGAELLVGELLVGLLEFVDAGDDGAGLLEELFIVTAGKALEEKGKHEGSGT